MQIPPLSVRLGWPKPNYVDPVTRGNGNIFVNIILYSLLFCFLGLRIFTRTRLRKAFGADDVFILLAMIPTTTFFIISILADARFLWTRHVYDIPVTYVTTGLKMVLAAQLMFAAACTLTKLSMLMFVRRMLSSATLFWRRVTLLAIAIVTLQGSVFCITVIFQCRPPQDYWKVTLGPQPNCINQGSSLLVAGIINTFTDFLVVLLPIRTVWSLQLATRQACLVVMLFAFGFISCCAGAIRTYYMFEVTRTWDQTWASYPVWMTSAIELYVGVLCASIPATKPFFSTYLPQIFGTLSSVNSHYTLPNSREQSHPASNGVVVSSGAGEEELMDFEKALAIEKSKSTTTVTSICGSTETRDSEEEDYIRITQTVHQVSG